jgi:hypothetical protein
MQDFGDSQRQVINMLMKIKAPAKIDYVSILVQFISDYNQWVIRS